MKSTTTQPSAEEKAASEKVQTLWQVILQNFLEHRMAVVGFVIIHLLILIALAAPLISKISGLDPEKQNPLHRYQPMFSYVPVSAEDSIELSTQLSTTTVEEFHVFGTDELGRDVLIRLIYGARVSMGVGILVAIVSALIGLLIGSFAGFYGGWIDSTLMRITDSLLSLPTMPVLIVVAAIDLDKLPWLRKLISTGNENILKMVFLLCLFSWMQVARLVRASVLSLREREFILAAKTLGARDRTIIFRHMFPNTIAPLLVSVTLGVGNSIIYEASLSFLGLGIQQPTSSWGNMLFNAQELIHEAPALAILPGLLILIVTISFNYLGDGLQDALDPKSVRR